MTSLADNREQHIQRFHQQLESWQQEMNRMRSLTFSANSYLQGEMNKRVAQLDKGLGQLTQKLVEVAETGDKRVYTALESLESAWGSLKSTIGDVSQRLRSKGEAAGEQLREGAEEAQDTLRHKVDQGMNQARQAANRGRQAARDTLQQGRDTARDIAEQGREALREGREVLRDTAEDVARAAQSATGGRRGGGSTGQADENVASRTSNPPQQH